MLRGVEHFEPGLLEVIDVAVVQAVTVQVGTDFGDDLVTETVAIDVQRDEIELLADGLQGFGEFCFKQFSQLIDVGGTLWIEHLGDCLDVFGLVVDPDEEGDLDVSPDVVLADEAVLAFTGDFDPLDGEVHHVRFLDERDDHHAVSRADVETADTGADDGFFGAGFAVEPRKQHSESDQHEHSNDYGNQYFSPGHRYTSCSARLTK